MKTLPLMNPTLMQKVLLQEEEAVEIQTEEHAVEEVQLEVHLPIIEALALEVLGCFQTKVTEIQLIQLVQQPTMVSLTQLIPGPTARQSK